MQCTTQLCGHIHKVLAVYLFALNKLWTWQQGSFHGRCHVSTEAQIGQKAANCDTVVAQFSNCKRH